MVSMTESASELPLKIDPAKNSVTEKTICNALPLVRGGFPGAGFTPFMRFQM